MTKKTKTPQPRLTQAQIDAKIDSLVERGALFVHNHSGGKDSQASYIKLRQRVPADQIVVIHAVLGEVEWDGCEEHIRSTIDPGVELILAHPFTDFWAMVERRGRFPSPSVRQCTSDLKRTPIDREIRRFLKRNPRFNGLVVNVEGLRAQESAERAKKNPFTFNADGSIAGREWYDWLIIHDMSELEVFATIAQAKQEPHWVYAAGMRRKSCCFCIYACDSDLKRAAELRPELYAKYCATERRLGFTLKMDRRTLPEITGIAA